MAEIESLKTVFREIVENAMLSTKIAQQDSCQHQEVPSIAGKLVLMFT